MNTVEALDNGKFSNKIWFRTLGTIKMNPTAKLASNLFRYDDQKVASTIEAESDRDKRKRDWRLGYKWAGLNNRPNYNKSGIR